MNNNLLEEIWDAREKINRACNHDTHTLFLRLENMADAFPPERFTPPPTQRQAPHLATNSFSSILIARETPDDDDDYLSNNGNISN